jgi:hypothetical protein
MVTCRDDERLTAPVKLQNSLERLVLSVLLRLGKERCPVTRSNAQPTIDPTHLRFQRRGFGGSLHVCPNRRVIVCVRA